MRYAQCFCIEKQAPTNSANEIGILPPPRSVTQNCITSLYRGKSFLPLSLLRPAAPCSPAVLAGACASSGAPASSAAGPRHCLLPTVWGSPVVLSSPALVTAGTKGGPAPCATAAAAEAAAGSEKQSSSVRHCSRCAPPVWAPSSTPAGAAPSLRGSSSSGHRTTAD